MKTRVLTEANQAEIVELLMGRRVEKVDEETLLLDNGLVLKLQGNDGGCSCDAGVYELTQLNGIENVITSVHLVDDPDGDEHPNGEGVYQIFVFAGDQRVNLATFEGTDGNGYYGTGYSIKIEGVVTDATA